MNKNPPNFIELVIIYDKDLPESFFIISMEEHRRNDLTTNLTVLFHLLLIFSLILYLKIQYEVQIFNLYLFELLLVLMEILLAW